MARAVELLLGNARLRKRIGDNASRDAAERFDLEGQADRYVSWYRELLASETPHGRRKTAQAEHMPADTQVRG